MREYHRLWLLSISDVVKLSFFCKKLNIKPSNLSNFLRFNDRSLSDKKIDDLCTLIKTYLSNLA